MSFKTVPEREKSETLKAIETRVARRLPRGRWWWVSYLALISLLLTGILLMATDNFSRFGFFIAILLVGATYPLSNRLAPIFAAGISTAGTILWLSRAGFQETDAAVVLVMTLLLVWSAAGIISYIRFLENEITEQSWRLKMGIEAGELGIFRWDTSNNDVEDFGKLRQLFEISERGHLSADAILDKIHPEDKEEVGEQINKALELGEEYAAEFRIILENGSERWIAGRGIASTGLKNNRQFLTGANWDITAKKQETENINKLMDGLKAVALLLSPDGKIVFANRYTIELMRADEKKLIGENIWDVFEDGAKGEDQPKLKEIISEARLLENAVYDVSLRLPELGVRRFALSLSSLQNDAGEVTYLVPTAIDITDRIKAEAEVTLLMQELNHRIKNLFSVTTALINLSARHSDDVQSFAASTINRLQALHTSHSLSGTDTTEISAYQKEISLKKLIETVLAPWQSGQAISIEGPDKLIAPGQATAFGVILHELSTNYAKYGAMPNKDGSLSVEIASTKNGFDVIWCESGVTSTEPLTVEGFGFSIIKTLSQNYLDGSAAFSLEGGKFKALIKVRAPST